MAGSYKQKMTRVVVLGTFIHFMLFVAVMDIYFASPVEKGMKPYRIQREVPAKRLVLIVSDGLRAESIYEAHQNRTPFITSIRKERGSWGVSHTRVPTESRPGHVALIAGLYEDPSAIFKGWKANPVDFDSVLNESTNSWSWGSPDIVDLFNRENKSHMHTESYEAESEDFGEVDTFLLDEWVFKKVNKFITDATTTLESCADVCKSGNIFFLHLLGLDTAGHSHKPNSKQHLKNIQVVDNGIKQVEDLFNGAFRDNATAFIFTSDHGMTDWGSHGDGSTFETETVFVAWGAGIKQINERHDINQADIAPLISTLLGNNIPVNSVGVLPHFYLNFSLEATASALIANARQLAEQYSVKSHKLQKTTIPMLYKPYAHDKDLFKHIDELQRKFEEKQFEEVIINSQDVIHIALDGLKYIQKYYRTPLLLFISAGFIFWLLYLAAIITDAIEKENSLFPKKKYVSTKAKNVICGFLSVIFIAIVIFINMQDLSTKIYLYALFPVVILFLLVTELDTFVTLWNLIGNFGWIEFGKLSTMYLLGIELIALSFFARESLFLLMACIGCWLYGTQIDKNKKLIWFCSLAILGVFTFFPTLSTMFIYRIFVFVSVAWVYLYYFQFRKVQNRFFNLHTVDRIVYTIVLYLQLMLFLAAAINTLVIAYYVDNEKELSTVFHLISWIIFVVSLLITPFAPTNLILRMGHIFSSFMSIYIMFCNYLEGPFILLLMLVLMQWIFYEYKLKPLSRGNSIFYYDFARKPKEVIKDNSADFRKSFFLLSFIIMSFFGTGNIASLSSFNPMWVRCFLTVFSPFTMFGLILVKITIPFLLVICAFRAVYLFSGRKVLNVFCIVLFYCDIIVLQFMFFVQDEGSWKEIGMQISKFIIVELISVIIISYYFIAYWLTTNAWYNVCVQNFTQFIAKKTWWR